MYDPTSAYRSTQVASSGPAAQVVLLYQAAIKFGLQHLAFLERGRREEANRASLRCQEIVAALRETLDLSAGPIAVQLDALYEFALERLMTGNIRCDPLVTEEALQVLRGLLEAWQAISASPTATAPHRPGDRSAQPLVGSAA